MWRVRHCRDTWAAALPLGMGGRYTERDDESPPELRVLLPEKHWRPLSTLTIHLFLLHNALFWVPRSSLTSDPMDSTFN
jgi:hypothetical protein